MQKPLKAYFLSDIHLSAPDDQRAVTLLKFLRSLSGPEQITHLFLMGDIFDLWIGKHKYFCERWVDVVSEFYRLYQRGVEVHYFEGNHDLYLQQYFGNQLGFNIHGEPIFIELGPWRLRLEHGDQMDPDDRGYIFLRWLLRTPVLRFIAANRFTEKYIVKLGERMSAASRDYTSNRKTISEAVARAKIRAHAEKIQTECKAAGGKAFDFLIAGHVHVSDRFELPAGGAAINLGSWLDQPKVLLLTESGAQFIEL